MTTITLIDYGIGNLLSVERAFRHMGADLNFARTHEDIKSAEKLILPGVGAFNSCIEELNKRNLSDPIREFITREKPLLGICVGMQMLFDNSEEFGIYKGFSFLKGAVKSIPASDTNGKTQKIPHIGWTSLTLPSERKSWENTIFKNVRPGDDVYFVHSFTAHPADNTDRLADAFYGGQLISAAVQRSNIIGVQFHPEKSGPVGLKILENFIRL